MVYAVEKLYLTVEVVGCPTICRHCWAKGTGYQAMPVGDIAFVLEQAHRFCEEHGLGFSAYPMHEVAAHPQAAAILRLFADHVGAAEFQPLTTTGVPLATRPEPCVYSVHHSSSPSACLPLADALPSAVAAAEWRALGAAAAVGTGSGAAPNDSSMPTTASRNRSRWR